MKRLLPLGVLLFALCAFPASAILDTNENGLSDLWERMHYDEELFPSADYPYGPQDDPDGDGWTNEQEAAAGTNPFDPNPPDGLLRPDIVHIPEVLGVSPEVVTITWTTIPGKQYTLLYSPDLVDWLPVPGETFISDGSPADYNFTLAEDSKLFWRVRIEDVDSDGDGLTDAEEAVLGTDSHNAQTLPDIPDLWLATYFTNTLLASGPGVIDPNSDPNSDGYTIVQEAFLNLNPNVSNTPITGPIGQETIVNGDFSQPAIGTGNRSSVSNPAWDYWGAGGLTGWSAVTGTNIELQKITPKDTGNPYCELKADPEGHYGIKQEVGTHKGTTYLLMFDCRDRADVAPSRSNFNVLIGAEIKCKISFTDSTGSDPLTKYIAPGDWTTVAVPFTASNPTTWLSLVPDIPGRCQDDKTGCLVDNVSLVLVDITVAFGLGPDPLGDQTSRELLEEYLDGIKLTHDDNVWAVKGKDDQDNEKIYGIEISNTQVMLVEALRKEGQTVVFDGHSNFGFGPDFGSNVIRRIADFTNFGSKYTDVPLDIRYTGSNPNPEEDPSNWGMQGYPFLGFTNDEIPNAPTNYKPLPINKLRFSPNDEGVGEGQVFTSQELEFAMWHFKIGGSKRLMVNAPNTDIPNKLAYKRFFYNVCNSGIDYIENFKQGEFIYTTNTCFVEKATKIFVQGIVEGKSSELVMPSLNQNGVGANNPPSPIYEFKSF